jgi:DNA-binding MarR family transcriptional regulator
VLTLTDAGRVLYDNEIPLALAVEAEQLASVTHNEREAFLRVVDKLASKTATLASGPQEVPSTRQEAL